MAQPLTDAELVLVFGLALVGYLGLTVLAVSAAHARRAAWLAWATLVVVTVHALLVWSLRFGFDLGVATRNGWGGFITFHLALATLACALPFPLTRRRGIAIIVAWVLVTTGAVAAPFRYPEIAALAVPVIAIAALGALGLGLALRR